MPYIDPMEIERVKQIDLLNYLMSNEPDELIKRSAREYITKSHDSLVISHGKWHWFSRGIGGKSALDYLIKVKCMRFLDAVNILLEASTTPVDPSQIATKISPTERPFVLPRKSASCDKAKSYLELRGIDSHVISDCIKRGLIYENHSDCYTNVVFVGKDNTDKPRYAFIRGCGGYFKGEAEGSNKRFSFRLTSNSLNPRLHVFESAIDALSFATIQLHNDVDWRGENLLSLGGIHKIKAWMYQTRIPQALSQWLGDRPSTREVILHLDNDTPGIMAADAIATALHGRVECSIVPPPFGKDMNDYLLGKDGLKKAKEAVR